MRLNRQKTVFLAACLCCLLGVGSLVYANLPPYNNSKYNLYGANLLEYMKDGMEDTSITEYYASDIEQLRTIMENKSVHIRYCDCDLNDDGLPDKVVILRSSYHTGSHGDRFEILLNKGEAYVPVFEAAFGLCMQDESMTPAGEVSLLESVHEGFHDIRVCPNGNEGLLTYINGTYDYEVLQYDAYGTVSHRIPQYLVL